MADITANTAGARSGNPIVFVLRKIWDGLVYLGENSARARTLQVLHNMSDEQLAQLGFTREEIVKRVFSDGYHI